jgi:hypothetical protein
MGELCAVEPPTFQLLIDLKGEALESFPLCEGVGRLRNTPKLFDETQDTDEM